MLHNKPTPIAIAADVVLRVASTYHRFITPQGSWLHWCTL